MQGGAGLAVDHGFDQQQPAVRGGPPGHVVLVVGDQPGPLPRGEVEPGDAGRVAVAVGGDDQRGSVRGPGEMLVPGAPVGLGELSVPA